MASELTHQMHLERAERVALLYALLFTPKNCNGQLLLYNTLGFVCPVFFFLFCWLWALQLLQLLPLKKIQARTEEALFIIFFLTLGTVKKKLQTYWSYCFARLHAGRPAAPSVGKKAINAHKKLQGKRRRRAKYSEKWHFICCKWLHFSRLQQIT